MCCHVLDALYIASYAVPEEQGSMACCMLPLHPITTSRRLADSGATMLISVDLLHSELLDALAVLPERQVPMQKSDNVS